MSEDSKPPAAPVADQPPPAPAANPAGAQSGKGSGSWLGQLLKGGWAEPPMPADWLWYLLVLAVGVVAVLVLAYFVVSTRRPLDTSNASAAPGVLALVTALAVGIERLLEAFWSLVDRIAPNPSWPFSSDAQLLTKFADQLTRYVKTPLTQADQRVQQAKAGTQPLPGDLDAIQAEVTGLLKSVDVVLKGQPSPTSSQSILQLQMGLTRIQADVPALKADLNAGIAALDGLSGILDSILTNPGRKIMSLFGGALIGLGVVGWLGLDLISAALGHKPPASWDWALAITGIVVGLGSNPTHELINAILAYQQQAQSTSAASSGP